MKIRKLSVADGVEWVEIEEADLRILCGCPADVVKHLMRRGLITQTMINGVECETGPNAILLADVMLQNGAFTNLAEFPALQMLYRQGMILPNHPNNTGEKPLLIGMPDQVDHQLSYIHRGNYGLLSEEELRQAGASEEETREWMRIKLHFAFGKLRPVSELLDSLKLGDRKTEIRNGVTSQRTGLSKYRIEYDGESVDVDMELPPEQAYASAYPLTIRRSYREYFSVIHSGQGDGWDIDRPCMSSIVCVQGRFYLIDCGPNLDAILNSLSISVNELAGIFHTHAHDDHFCGLPALLTTDRRLTHYAVPVVRASIARKFGSLVGEGEDFFERFFDCVDLVQGEWNSLDGFEVQPIASPHPVETTIMNFRVLDTDGYKTYSHLADIASFEVLDTMVNEDENEPGLSAKRCAEVKEQYLAPADIKKVDVGGGLIHGNSGDFKGDQSTKLILAHIARKLTIEEMQFGSGADMGTEDILIKNLGADYHYQMAAKNLGIHFDSLSSSQIQPLLNNKIKTFNPQEILMPEGQRCDHVIQVVSGNVERFKQGEVGIATMTAGATLGELWAIAEIPAYVTYRAGSYVRALMMPARQYQAFVEEFGLREHIEELALKRRWLRRTKIFGDGIAYERLNFIADHMRAVELENGRVEQYGSDREHLYLIEEGTLKRMVGDTVLETMGPGDLFNEGCSIFDWESQSSVVSVGPSKVWCIPVEAFESVPKIVWMLFELFRRRISAVPESRLAAE